jgi:uncharacterized protein
MMMDSIQNLVEALSLAPHPEGGYYRQTYRSSVVIPASALPEGYTGWRACSTAIYYLLAGEDFSAFHRIRSDEIWHFYAGSRLDIHVIHPGGEYDCIRLGSDFEGGQVFQAVVPGSCWFGAHVAQPGGYALVGCTVSPGFDFEDFELGDRDELTREYPQHAAIIERLTRI